MPATRLVLIIAALVSTVAATPSAAAAPVRPDVQTVSLGSATPVGEAREVIHRRTFSMVAVRWRGERPGRIEVQTRRPDGAWSAWTELEPIDIERDGVGEVRATEPVWVGDATSARVRADVDPARLDVVLIDPGRAKADAAPVTTQAVGQPAVISRAGWGADESLRCLPPEYMSTIKAATIHHTAGTNDYAPADSAAIVRGIYVYHAQTLGWCDIGYNALVDKYGQIFEGTFGGLDRAVKGAHAGGFNNFTFGISMMGIYTGVAPTDTQLESVSRMVAWKLAGSYRNPLGQVTLVSTGGGTSKYPAGTPVTLPVIFAHRDVGNTECPGNVGYQQMSRIRDRVSALVGDWTNTPVYRKWQALGGESGVLGSPHRLEQPGLNNGLNAWFAGGTWHQAVIYYSPATNAHEIHGNIAAKWATFGWERGNLGYPTTDETPAADQIGRFNHFQGGSIYWSPSTGAHEIHGLIRARWAELGWESGRLGYPTTDETPAADQVGRFNHFSRNASIYWSPSTGAHEVYGAIRSHWAQLGWERSYLGYPRTGEYAVPEGRRTDFQHGYIFWNATTNQTSDHRY